MGDAIRKRNTWLTSGESAGAIIDGVKYTLDNGKIQAIKMNDLIDESQTSYIHYATNNSDYSESYLLNVSVVEFYAILGRIQDDIQSKIDNLKKQKHG